MATSEKHDYICRVGAGTPMGEAMRRYWWPACLSEDIASPDSDPKHVRLLGEDFVVFRDSKGRVGFLDEHCCHRGASLTLGRVEECGIRCIYHGWKFGVDGALQEAPNVADPKFVQAGRVKQRAYPVIEAGGFIWAYIGPIEKKPPFRRFHWFEYPPENIYCMRVKVPANYLQVMEGGIDASHLYMLHQDFWKNAPEVRGKKFERPSYNDAPSIEVGYTDFGLFFSAERPVTTEKNGPPTGKKHVYIQAIVTPAMTVLPPGLTSIMYVPVDDENTEWLLTIYNATQAVTKEAVERLTKIDQFPKFFEKRSNINHGFDVVLNASRANGYGQDRQAMRDGTQWSGLGCGHLEDGGVQVSMGAIQDRTQEHLVPSDRPILLNRQLLRLSADRVTEGRDPLAVQLADLSKVTAPAEYIVDEGTDWRTLIPNNYPITEVAPWREPEQDDEQRVRPVSRIGT